MKQVIAVAVLLPLPALALQIPQSAKNGDPRVCNVAFNPDEIVDVTVPAGNTVTLKFGPNERVAYVSVSDSAHLKFFVAEGSNGVWLKATDAMPAQPVSIRTLKEDGTPRDYTLQWTALDTPPTPASTDRIALASAAPTVHVSEEPARPPRMCYTIRFQYPADDAAAAAAKWRVAQARAKNDAAEIALHQAPPAAVRNVRYVAMGDLQIGPTEIFDDGNTTELHFPGNMRLPTIYTVAPDGAEAVVGGVTTEDNGVVKVLAPCRSCGCAMAGWCCASSTSPTTPSARGRGPGPPTLTSGGPWALPDERGRRAAACPGVRGQDGQAMGEDRDLGGGRCGDCRAGGADHREHPVPAPLAAAAGGREGVDDGADQPTGPPGAARGGRSPAAKGGHTAATGGHCAGEQRPRQGVRVANRRLPDQGQCEHGRADRGQDRGREISAQRIARYPQTARPMHSRHRWCRPGWTAHGLPSCRTRAG